jgi:hypothetical protein
MRANESTVETILARMEQHIARPFAVDRFEFLETDEIESLLIHEARLIAPMIYSHPHAWSAP